MTAPTPHSTTHRNPAPPPLPDDIATPAYVLDVAALERNLATARRIKQQAGVKMLLATKAWAMPVAFPVMRDTLDGTTASGLYEARLGREEFGKEVHVYAPAYAAREIDELVTIADHIYFNSPSQIARFLPAVKKAGKHAGLRINPGFSFVSLGGDLYNPCAPGSRFGTPADQLDAVPWDDVHTLHAHALCEATHDGSAGLIAHVAKNFATYLMRVKAVNFGGGHFVNKPGYDVDKLIAALKSFREAFPHLEVVLEPGAGLVVDTGYLVATVLDTMRNGSDIAILDTSASTHMPDVLEVPYTPEIIGAGRPGEKRHDYVLGGKTCMTGDVIGTYSFDAPLQPGDRLVFTDMMQYSFVKNTTFNGTPLPDIAMLDVDGTYRVVRRYGYQQFRERLG
ncbi:MAG: carboxynorspermidine decarboxylase [Hyphomicrobiaceae bacterium]|nr:carboxynorspermidine decarboxylase [Hyphomicrobiaceae bacterium]